MLDRTIDMQTEARLRVPIYETANPTLTEAEAAQREATRTHAIAVKGAYQELVCLILQACAPSREAQLALKDLETSSMWAVKSLHMHGPSVQVKDSSQ